MLDLSSVTAADKQAAKRIAAGAGVNLDDCYQCGKCSAGCPMGHAMDYVPRRVIRLLQLGFVDKALNARSPWICAQCSVCSCRCPQDVNITELMLAVRLEAKERAEHGRGRIPFKESDIFDDVFIANVRRWGRSNEAVLAMLYNFKSGHLMQDVLNAPKMAARGMIGPKIHKIKGRNQVRDMVDAVMKDEVTDKNGGDA
jgi:heterodisulfide reductase subunit C